ncbi:MAG: long-chain fatty acid--CoA ligase, partial [Candidatus Eremiobacteraeota bacterium]|nr:long-chain fatty acid--CoA ligase [Candidatus Eremiobacteraeota bacterium]
MTLSLASVLAESAQRHSDRAAIVFEGRRISYRTLWEEARRYAHVLRALGIRPGDRVAIMLGNVPDFPRAYFGILALGAVAVPVHALLTAEEVAYLLSDSGARFVLSAEPLLPVADAGAAAASIRAVDTAVIDADPIVGHVPREPDDDAVILYTSGTTGSPKGAVLTHGNLVWNTTIAALDMLEATPNDVFLGALPLFHSFGQNVVMNAAFRAGACVALMQRFNADAALELMEREGVTIYEGVPTMTMALVEAYKRHPRNIPLRGAKSGGASLPVAVLEEFERLFGVPIYEGYGLSETSPVASFNQKCFGRKPGTVGCGIWGVDLAIARADIDDRIELLPDGELGEIVIRGHNIFKGYLNKPEATAAAIVDGWFRTGDLGTRDADGFISIVDRKKDLIIRGGFNVYPREIEEVLIRHPDVAQVAVIGVPHDTHGEEVVAVVVTQNANGFEAAALIEWSQQY